MGGKKVKFYKYEGTSGRLNLPNSITDALGWEHEDEIIAQFKSIEGQEGLFIFKKKRNNIKKI